jgi:hypothetical protein
LRRQFEGWSDVVIVLDGREGERRMSQDPFTGTDQMRVERRRQVTGEPFLKLGWAVADTDELVS